MQHGNLIPVPLLLQIETTGLACWNISGAPWNNKLGERWSSMLWSAAENGSRSNKKKKQNTPKEKQ